MDARYAVRARTSDGRVPMKRRQGKRRRGSGARLAFLLVEKAPDDDQEVQRVRLHPRLVLVVQRRHHTANEALRGSTLHMVFPSQRRGFQVPDLASYFRTNMEIGRSTGASVRSMGEPNQAHAAAMATVLELHSLPACGCSQRGEIKFLNPFEPGNIWRRGAWRRGRTR